MKYYNITSTLYTGSVTIRLTYDDTGISPEQEIFIQIWLWNETSSTWIDITTSVDTENNRICGIAPHLSIFGVTRLPSSPAEITIVNTATSKTVVNQGYNVTINITLQNQGDFTQTFDLTVYRNSTMIAKQQVTLSPTAERFLSFTCNTTDWPKGNHTISVFDQRANWVIVTITGDVDGDFDVDIIDVVKITSIYGSKLGDPEFKPNSDIDCDGKITILDVVKCACNYGQKDP